MTSSQQSPTMEHPLDVLRAAMAFAKAGQAYALAIVTDTEGGAVRAPGAMMAIAESGMSAGYVSGGCIDSDVRVRAQQAIKHNKVEQLKYGKGSPFIDIRLPCGGSIDLTVLPNPDQGIVRKSIQSLEARQTIALNVSAGNLQLDDFETKNEASFAYRPKLHLRIAGRGVEPLALANIAIAGGLTCELWSPDEDCVAAAEEAENLSSVQLTSPYDLPKFSDSQETAFVLMFHDKEWETALLKQAVAGPAFYIGAVGSKTTHAARNQKLIEAGLSKQELDRIRGPIGLVPSMRDAAMLAYSVLAEIVHEFHVSSRVQP